MSKLNESDEKSYIDDDKPKRKPLCSTCGDLTLSKSNRNIALVNLIISLVFVSFIIVFYYFYTEFLVNDTNAFIIFGVIVPIFMITLTILGVYFKRRVNKTKIE